MKGLGYIDYALIFNVVVMFVCVYLSFGLVDLILRVCGVIYFSVIGFLSLYIVCSNYIDYMKKGEVKE